MKGKDLLIAFNVKMPKPAVSDPEEEPVEEVEAEAPAESFLPGSWNYILEQVEAFKAKHPDHVSAYTNVPESMSVGQTWVSSHVVYPTKPYQQYSIATSTEGGYCQCDHIMERHVTLYAPTGDEQVQCAQCACTEFRLGADPQIPPIRCNCGDRFQFNGWATIKDGRPQSASLFCETCGRHAEVTAEFIYKYKGYSKGYSKGDFDAVSGTFHGQLDKKEAFYKYYYNQFLPDTKPSKSIDFDATNITVIDP